MNIPIMILILSILLTFSIEIPFTYQSSELFGCSFRTQVTFRPVQDSWELWCHRWCWIQVRRRCLSCLKSLLSLADPKPDKLCLTEISRWKTLLTPWFEPTTFRLGVCMSWSAIQIWSHLASLCTIRLLLGCIAAADTATILITSNQTLCLYI